MVCEIFPSDILEGKQILCLVFHRLLFISKLGTCLSMKRRRQLSTVLIASIFPICPNFSVEENPIQFNYLTDIPFRDKAKRGPSGQNAQASVEKQQ